MNKLQGFYELKKLGIPYVPWKKFDEKTDLDPSLLWTIRTAKESGNDIGLPRAVGVNASEAKEKAIRYLCNIKNSGIVIYYPYFLAIKSGIIDINSKRIVIEAVKNDLWNLVNHGKRDITIIVSSADIEYKGQPDFLGKTELDELLSCAKIVKNKLRDLVNDGKSILLEWSFAQDSDALGKPKNKKYLVFYECRAI